jgi:hypothetical protein
VRRQILDAIAWERRGGLLIARLGIRPGEIRALDLDASQQGRLRVARAIHGPSAKTPTGPTKTRRPPGFPSSTTGCAAG